MSSPGTSESVTVDPVCMCSGQNTSDAWLDRAILTLRGVPEPPEHSTSHTERETWGASGSAADSGFSRLPREGILSSPGTSESVTGDVCMCSGLEHLLCLA